MLASDTKTPQHFLAVLYHGHQLLDSAGPWDILSTITKVPEGANFTMTIAAESYDPINLAPIPPKGADWSFEQISELPNVKDENGQSRIGGSGFNPKLSPDIAFDEALDQLKSKGSITVDGSERTIDVLVIPGGIGSRMMRINGSGQRSLNVQSCVDFTRDVCLGNFVQSAVLTVCTGSDLLARTGLLDGRRATTNHRAFSKVAERHQNVQWLEKRRWVRSLPDETQSKSAFNKEIWTGAGISAGMDLTLWFVAEVYGMDFAHDVSRKLEYEWRDQVKEGEIDPYY